MCGCVCVCVCVRFSIEIFAFEREVTIVRKCFKDKCGLPKTDITCDDERYIDFR